MNEVIVHHGDCLDVLRTMKSNSVDAVVSDPPAGIAFMGKGWDEDKGGRIRWTAWLASVMRECLRVLKPGGHALVWSLPRTSHWTAMALENAGFETRDCIAHCFGSGFPKSRNISKAIDAVAGATREVIGIKRGTHAVNESGLGGTATGVKQHGIDVDVTAPATDDAKKWDGWGSGLKPAVEMWWLCRKPLAKATIEAQVLATGTGAINIAATRAASCGDALVRPPISRTDNAVLGHGRGVGKQTEPSGRWPANLVLSHSDGCVRVGEHARTVGDGSGRTRPITNESANNSMSGKNYPRDAKGIAYAPSGVEQIPEYECVEGCAIALMNQQQEDAARFFNTFEPDHDPFFYAAKPSVRERNIGCEGLETRTAGVPSGPGGFSGGSIPRTNVHPTVKSQALMRHLVKLITPPGGTVLDPFSGSGSTLVAAKTLGFNAIGIEKEAEYAAIINARLAAVK